MPETRSWLNGQGVFQPTRLESKWKSCFDDSTENSEEPLYLKAGLSQTPRIKAI